MPALFRRSRRDDVDDVEPAPSTPSIASLIVNHLESSSEQEPALSHRQFREFVRDRGRSQDEALSAIRMAARNNGRR